MIQFQYRKNIAAMACALIVILGCGKEEKSVEAASPAPSESTERTVSLTSEGLKASSIQTEVIAASSANAVMKFTGTVEPNALQTQEVTPLVAGRIDSVHASLGDRVRAGATLATMSSPEVAEIHGQLLQANAKLTLAESTLRRSQKLSDLGAAAGKDLAAAQAESSAARAEVAHLRAALRSIGAVAETRGHSVAAVAVRSPISGVVTQRNVNPGSGVEAGKPLFTVANLSTVWVIANVPESQVAALTQGAAAEVRAASLVNTSLPGRVAFIDPNLNESTRTARVRIDVPNTGERLKAGMFCEVTIAGAVLSAQQLTVPESAVQKIGDDSVVFVDLGNGKFAARPVQLGEKSGDRVAVLSGVTAGDRVVTAGSFTLKSQMLKSEFAESD